MVSDIRISDKAGFDALIDSLWAFGNVTADGRKTLLRVGEELVTQPVYKFRFRRLKRDEGIRTACTLEIIAKTEKEALHAAKVLSDDIDVLKEDKFLYALLTVREID